MISAIKSVLDRRSTREKLIDAPVESGKLIDAPEGTLDRRVIPTLVVKHHPDEHGKAHLRGIRLATICIENRLTNDHPEIADNIDTYSWYASDEGPMSRDHWEDIHEMGATDWSTLAPLGGKKSWTYGGSLRFTLYAIDTTDKFLDGWFKRTDIDRETIEGVVEDVMSEHEVEYGLNTSSLLDEAVEIRQEFRMESYMH